MKRKLKKTHKDLYYYSDEEKIIGKNPKMNGDCSGLRGDCTYLSGNCTGLRGVCTYLSGDCTGIRGDLDDCEITDEEREKGININDLIDIGYL